MNTHTLGIVITSLVLGPFAIGGSNTNSPPVTPANPAASPAAAVAPVDPSASPAAVSTTQSPITAVTQPTPPAPADAEPTEAEMRAAVQRHLDSINSQMRPPPAPSTSSSQPKYIYSPYWRYYGYGHGYKYSKESDYENWTDVARRAHATARVEITSFKKIRCTPEPDQGGFSAEYIAELELRGASNPAAQEIMQTSGKRLKGLFYKGDKGWIFGEAPNETK